MVLSKKGLIDLRKQFTELCKYKGDCSDCKYAKSEDCFVEFVFDNNRELYPKEIQVLDLDKDNFYRANLKLVGGGEASYIVNYKYFLKVKRYVVSIIDKDGKENILNKSKVRSIFLGKYSFNGELLDESLLWQRGV